MAIAMQKTDSAVSPSMHRDRVAPHLPLARRVALRYHQRTGTDYDDLFQVASLALVRALRRFDPELGSTFESYAVATMGGEILHYLRDHAAAIRPPRELVEMRSTVRQAFETLHHELHRDPSAAEVSDRVGLPERKVHEVLGLERKTRPLSLDAESEFDEDGPGIRFQIPDERTQDRCRMAELRIVVQDALARLRPASRDAIVWAFFDGHSQQQIADRTGVSQTQVSRRIRAGLRDLSGLLLGCDEA